MTRKSLRVGCKSFLCIGYSRRTAESASAGREKDRTRNAEREKGKGVCVGVRERDESPAREKLQMSATEETESLEFPICIAWFMRARTRGLCARARVLSTQFVCNTNSTV